MSRELRDQHGWAILLPYDDHKILPLAGRYWFSHEPFVPWMDGYRVAVFRTRDDARHWNREKRCKGRVVRVVVRMEVA